MSSEHGRAREAEEAKRGGHEEESGTATEEAGEENNVPGAGVACVILAQQSAPNATRVVGLSVFLRPVKMVDCPPNYTFTYRNDAVGTAKLTEMVLSPMLIRRRSWT